MNEYQRMKKIVKQVESVQGYSDTEASTPDVMLEIHKHIKSVQAAFEEANNVTGKESSFYRQKNGDTHLMSRLPFLSSYGDKPASKFLKIWM